MIGRSLLCPVDFHRWHRQRAALAVGAFKNNDGAGAKLVPCSLVRGQHIGGHIGRPHRPVGGNSIHLGVDLGFGVGKLGLGLSDTGLHGFGFGRELVKLGIEGLGEFHLLDDFVFDGALVAPDRRDLFLKRLGFLWRRNTAAVEIAVYLVELGFEGGYFILVTFLHARHGIAFGLDVGLLFVNLIELGLKVGQLPTCRDFAPGMRELRQGRVEGLDFEELLKRCVHDSIASRS